WYRIFSFPDHTHFNLASQEDPKRHSDMWRAVGPGYTMQNVNKTEPFMDECITLLRCQLMVLALRGQPVDFDKWFTFLSLDVVGQATFSTRLGYLDTGRDVGLAISTVKIVAAYTAIMGQFTWLHDLTLGNLLLGKLGIQPHVKMMGICKPIIKARKENPSPRRDMMAELLAMQAKFPDKVKDFDIENAAQLNIAAGAEGGFILHCIFSILSNQKLTTGGVTQAFVYHLLRNPKHLKRLRAEIDEANAKGELSSVAQFTETQKLPFLQACIKETYRMYCPIGVGMPRVVPDGRRTICSKYFVGGTILNINSYAIHRYPKIFGADTNTFNPERWLSIDDEEYKRMERNLVHWGAGYNKCAGHHLSHFQMCKVTATLLRDFDFGQICPEKEWVQPHGWPCWVKARGQVS
ncbi:cytochrome P450, partial [Lindgomyces ingoldianus]